MISYTPLRSVWTTLRVLLLPLIIVIVTVSLGLLFHIRGIRVTEEQMRERLLNTVSIAALTIDAEDLAQIQEPKDMQTPVFLQVAKTLEQIRTRSAHVRFVYIFRKTDDSNSLAFVADADAILTPDQLDKDGNGRVDEYEEAAMTGDLYPIAKKSALQGLAFEMPVVDPEITRDQWGTLISAYAPIRSSDGQAVATLGIDMEAEEFYSISRNTFSLIAVSLMGLMGMLLGLYVLIVMRSRDIESLKNLDSERTALMDLATHQLGMPLATFKWWLEILKEQDKKFCERGGICDELQMGVDRMDMIIQGLHEASDLQVSLSRMKAAKTDLRDNVMHIVKDLEMRAKSRKQKVVTDIPANLPLVTLDKKLLQGLVRELMENAFSYSKSGKTVSITAQKNGSTVRLCIADEGIGIPKEDIAHLGQKFRRATNASSIKPVGNGLGLYIVKKILEKANGRLRISSQEGKGTTICIHLPIAS